MHANINSIARLKEILKSCSVQALEPPLGKTTKIIFFHADIFLFYGEIRRFFFGSRRKRLSGEKHSFVYKTVENKKEIEKEACLITVFSLK